MKSHRLSWKWCERIVNYEALLEGEGSRQPVSQTLTGITTPGGGTMWPTDKELKKQSDSTHRNTREREMVTDTERKPETSVQEKSEKRYVERGREVNNGKVSRNVTDRFQRYFKWLVALVWGWIPQTLNFGDLLTLTEYLQSVNMQNIIWHSWSPEDDSLMAPPAGW